MTSVEATPLKMDSTVNKHFGFFLIMALTTSISAASFVIVVGPMSCNFCMSSSQSSSVSSSIMSEFEIFCTVRDDARLALSMRSSSIIGW